jgi:SSS family solute:Na+ symporter
MPDLAKLVLGHPVSNSLYLFPVIFIISAIGCFLGTFFGEAEDEVTLKNFYKSVNPWGFWGTIRAKVMQEDPSFRPNPNFKRDTGNVLIGIVWQLCLTALPIYIVLQHWSWVGAIAATLLVTSVILKFSWYDKLEKA